MDSEKNNFSNISNNRFYPTRIVPEPINLFSADCNEHFFDQCSPAVFLALEKDKDEQYIDINLLDVNLSSDFGFPNSSKNICNERKSQVATRDEVKYDNSIFDFHLNGDNEITGDSLFDNHEEILLNCEIIDKLNENSILGEHKDKMGWDAANYENEISFGGFEENPWNFFEENVDKNVESLTQSWNLGEISYETQVSNDQIITPKKTVDITKIKGWKKKKFVVQGSPSIYSNDSTDAYINSYTSHDEELTSFTTQNEAVKIKSGDINNKKSIDDADINYAFVCDRLDNFLDEEAELNINYEIPHLHAEFGIKLTSEDLVSRPKFENIGEEKLKHSALIPLNSISNQQISYDLKAESLGTNMRYKRCKKYNSSKKNNSIYKCRKPYKLNKKKVITKNENPRNRGRPVKENIRKKNVKDTAAKLSRRSFKIKKSIACHEGSNKRNCCSDGGGKTRINDSKKVHKNKRKLIGNPFVKHSKVYNIEKKKMSNFFLKVFSFGMVVYPGPFAPLNQFIRFHLQKIRSYRTSIDKNWAVFATSAVVSTSKPIQRRRMILPVKCCFKCKKESSSKNKSKKLNPDESHAPQRNSTGNFIKESKNSEGKSLSFNVDFQEIRNVVENLINSVPDDSNKKAEISEKTISAKADVGIKDKHRVCGVSNSVLSNKKFLFDASKNENECSDLKKKLITNSNSRYNLRDHSLSLKKMSSFYPCNRADHKSLNSSNTTNNKFEHSKKEIDFSNVAQIQYTQNLSSENKDIKEVMNENSVLGKKISLVVDEKNSDVSTEINDSYKLKELNGNLHTPLKLNQMSFDNAVTKLLTKKLNVLKAIHRENSIDVLKNMKPNVLELIKLNFVKENFLTGYINIWYVKFEDRARSRVYLTFTKNPPISGAINLKMSSKILREELPNVINEIITKDKQFDSNDFAILFCDGKLWEIHGSVNFTVESNKSPLKFNETIQVYQLTKKMLPELHYLKEIKFIENKNKVSKWWIMNMLQKCTEIVIKYGDEIGRINCARLMQSSNLGVSNFILFNGIRNFLPVGISVNPRFWPYVLIGPFDVNENHKLGLKLHHEIVPFEYYLPLDRINSDFLLQRFVSSVILHSWKNNKQVVGMWLYDKTSERGSFIEVRTKYKNVHDYQREIEHDYSSSQMQNVLEEVNLDDVPKHMRGSAEEVDGNLKREIYLVPNITGLGYLKGVLQPDRSIVIEHPLKPNRKIRSHHIGEWLNKIMRRRIIFIPKDLDLKWRVVRDVSELKDQKPLSKFCLGGTHILCSKGLFYLLSMTKEKIRNLGLNESFVLKIIMENPVIEEVIQVKELGKLLLKKDECNLKMSEVLRLAVKEIETLEEQKISLRKLKDNTEKRREYLCRKYINVLESCDIDENMKKTIYFYIRKILQNKSGKFSLSDGKSENCQCLEAINKFLKKSIKNSEMEFHESEENVDAILDSIESKIGSTSSEDLDEKEKYLNGTSFNIEQSDLDNDIVRKLELKIIYLYEILNKNKLENASVQQKLTARLNMLADHLNKIKNSFIESEEFSCSVNDMQSRSLLPADENKCKVSSEIQSLPEIINTITENEKKLDFNTSNSIMDAIYDYSLNTASDDISFIDINKYLYERNNVHSDSYSIKDMGSECVRNFKGNKLGKPFMKSFRLKSLLKKPKKIEDSEVKDIVYDIKNKELDFNENSLDEDEGEREHFSRTLSEAAKKSEKESNKHLEQINISQICDSKHPTSLMLSKNSTVNRISNKYPQRRECLGSFQNQKEYLPQLDEELEYRNLRYQNRSPCNEPKYFAPYKKSFKPNEEVDLFGSFNKYVTFQIPKDTSVSEAVSTNTLYDGVLSNANSLKNGKRIILLKKRKLSEQSPVVLLKRLKNN